MTDQKELWGTRPFSSRTRLLLLRALLERCRDHFPGPGPYTPEALAQFKDPLRRDQAMLGMELDEIFVMMDEWVRETD